jgi:hypothetical protein
VGIMKVTVEIDAPELGAKIKAAIDQDDRSVQIISTGIGVSDATIYNIMGEKYDSVPLKTIRNLERFLDVNFGIDLSIPEGDFYLG